MIALTRRIRPYARISFTLTSVDENKQKTVIFSTKCNFSQILRIGPTKTQCQNDAGRLRMLRLTLISIIHNILEVIAIRNF